jgi:hypothetical protein
VLNKAKNSFLGEINQIVIRFLKFKKGQLELLQTQE